MSLLHKVEPGYDTNVGLFKGVNIGVGRLNVQRATTQM